MVGVGHGLEVIAPVDLRLRRVVVPVLLLQRPEGPQLGGCQRALDPVRQARVPAAFAAMRGLHGLARPRAVMSRRLQAAALSSISAPAMN
eukprot:4052986-Pyramimonas_sp.AAC.1